MIGDGVEVTKPPLPTPLKVASLKVIYAPPCDFQTSIPFPPLPNCDPVVKVPPGISKYNLELPSV
jgi:hypothetical protein